MPEEIYQLGATAVVAIMAIWALVQVRKNKKGKTYSETGNILRQIL